MGEVGYSRREFLHELRYWEILVTIRGYYRRSHSLWEAARYVSFCTVKAVGGAENINTPQDLGLFTWETKDEVQDATTDEDIERLRRMIREENEKNSPLK